MKRRKTYQPSVKVFPSEDEIAHYAAEKITGVIMKKPAAILMFAAGNSTKGMLQSLIDDYYEKKVDFSRVKIVGLDEYWPIKNDDRISTAKRMWENFHSKVNISTHQLVLPNGSAVDLDKEVKRFSDAVERLGPFDISVVGMGPGKTCHVGMNNPYSSVDSRVRSITLDRESRDAMMKKLNLEDNQIPQIGITLGMANILESREIMMIALGETKAWGVQRSLKGPIHEESPASLLRYHPKTLYVLDQQAATLLS